MDYLLFINLTEQNVLFTGIWMLFALGLTVGLSIWNKGHKKERPKRIYPHEGTETLDL